MQLTKPKDLPRAIVDRLVKDAIEDLRNQGKFNSTSEWAVRQQIIKECEQLDLKKRIADGELK